MTIPNLIVPVLNRPDLLTAMLLSIDHPIDNLVIVDNGDVVNDKWILETCYVIKPGHNLGVGASWNLGMKSTPLGPWWLIVNSDIEFGEGDLERTANAIRPDPAIYYMLGMAAFVLNMETVAAVGYFDENFHPAYNEDLDYARRAKLIGIPELQVGFTGTHVGSATIYSNLQYRAWNAATHTMNDRYYQEKWGGPKQGGETFTTPFNRGGSVRDWALDPIRLARQAWPRSSDDGQRVEDRPGQEVR